jgi:uncharacterized protein YodC (DUF2158 family)
MERKYRVRDKVKLVSGGAEMTVGGYPADDPLEGLDLIEKRNPPGNYYICTWFESGNRRREAEFHEDALVKVPS